MNYLLASFFLLLSISLFFKKYILSITNIIFKNYSIKKMGIGIALFGIFIIYISTNQADWNEVMWRLTTLILGLLLILRGILMSLLGNKLYKLLDVFERHYYKLTVPISLILISFSEQFSWSKKNFKKQNNLFAKQLNLILISFKLI